jgi:hypothetical protein
MEEQVMHTPRTPLSRLSRDPVVRAFLDRSARDAGQAFAVPAANPPTLSGGAAKPVRRVLELA